MKSGSGVVLTLDTTMLPQNYFIQENSKDEIEYKGHEEILLEEAEEKQSKYKKCRVRVQMFLDEQFYGETVKVLKLVEVNENEEIKRQKK